MTYRGIHRGWEKKEHNSRRHYHGKIVPRDGHSLTFTGKSMAAVILAVRGMSEGDTIMLTRDKDVTGD